MFKTLQENTSGLLTLEVVLICDNNYPIVIRLGHSGSGAHNIPHKILFLFYFF